MRAFSLSLPMALMRAREAVMATFRPMLRQHGLSEQQWRVLRALTASTKPLKVGEIARSTFISLPSLSRLLKTLEARGVLRRAVHATDVRAAQISLTRRGHALVAKIAPHSELGYASIADRIGAAKLMQLYRLLEVVEASLAPGDPEDD
jgi:homoprotocatechuate degradation regulator HpaR